VTVAAGVDVGGTFTDGVVIDPAGGIRTGKVMSTPQDQGIGVVAALEVIAPSASTDAGDRVTRLVHGTTVVTNLLLERTGARVVLCATAGATDLLELRRQDRASLYDLTAHHPAPLVAPADLVAVEERRVPGGVAIPLTDATIAAVVREVLARDPEIVVIALLHAYEDDAHERRLAEALRAARPTLEVVTAASVLPEIREYERTATAVTEGYARPRVVRYLEGLGERLRAAGRPAPAVMTSAGGMRSAADAARHAATLALSGPAGGIVGAATVLAAIGVTDALTIDIGGTSADAGLILGGEPLVESGGLVAGIPLALPRVLVETVSAGGGSIGWIDDGGALRVGPRSAGAVPGPAAFGRGGTEPTVTDAQLVLGRIGLEGFSAGLTLDRDAATRAIARLAAPLGSTVERTAQAMLDIANAEMARALRRVSVDRGVDPRTCALVAFGGGGPLHAVALADALGMPTVIVPPHAGVLSAVGLAIAPERREVAVSLLERLDALPVARWRAACETLAAQVEGADRTWSLRVRYLGQGHELTIPATPDEDPPALIERFTAAHRARYGFSLPQPVESVALRHVATTPGVAARFTRDRTERPFDAERGIDHGGPAETIVPGPRSILLPDATAWIAAGWEATALEIGGWVLRGAEGR
jgi:N-methylhydantoinase A